MTGKPGRSGGRRSNQMGRPPKPQNTRHNISVDNDVWKWLDSQGASETIEQLAREKMEETKYYYCKVCGAIWYEAEDGTPLHCAWVTEAPAEIVEIAIKNEKPCGCTE